MASIRKKGNRWQAQVRRIGHRSQTKSFIRRSDAETWARQIEVKFDEGLVVDVKRDLREITLGNLLTRYLAEVSCKKRGFVYEKCRIKNLLRLPVSDITLDRLTGLEISSYIREREAKIKPSSMKRELTVIKHCLQVARTLWGLRLSSNPFENIQYRFQEVPRQRRMELSEAYKIDQTLQSCRNPLIRHAFQFALATGMRRGELLALKWTDVDLGSATAYLPQTKNGEPRRVPLSPQAIQTLRSLAETRNARPEPRQSHHEAFQKGSDLVFPISANALRLAWERAKKRAGIKDFRFHDLRHEAISRFFEMGLSVPEVALISGHKDPRMLFRYTHLKAENVAQKLAVLGGAGAGLEKASGDGSGG